MKDIIVQFVGFVTQLDTEEFIPVWKPYAKELVHDPVNILLQEAVMERSGNKFKFLSQHESRINDFNFAFVKGRTRSHLPEHKAKVVQTGGYIILQRECEQKESRGLVKVMAFLPHGESALEFYYAQKQRYLNVYEAYFENCTYGHIMEFFLKESEAPALISTLKTRAGVEVAIYKKCPIIQSAEKYSGSLS